MTEVLRIGAFFDGTGNNKKNDLAIGDGSQTNVAKLYQLYEDKGYKARYEEGVGTEAYKEGGATLSKEAINDIRNGTIKVGDLYNSGSMGFGTTAKYHVKSMLDKIDTIIKQNPDKKIIIDVYGFSRGATEARDFVNEINKIYTNVDGGSVVGFVGLFDTVASIGFAADYDFDLNLNLDTKSAEKIFQIRAEDEMRSNFPLDSLKNSECSNIAEISLRGVHADIGGGYGALDLKKTLVVEGTHTTETFFLEKDVKARIEQLELELSTFEASHLDGKYELKYEVTMAASQFQTYKLESLIVENHGIEYGLSNVALNKMYSQITASGIGLPALSSLGSAPLLVGGDNLWQAPTPPYEKYIHVSASDNWYGGTFTDWLAHREEWNWDGIRDTYHNDSEKAELELVMLSGEDKAILNERRSDDYTIFGLTEAHLSVLENYSEKFVEHRADFLGMHLNPDKRFVPGSPGTSDGTLYKDLITGQEYRGDRLLNIDEVIFGSNDKDEIRLDQGLLSYFTSSNQIVYGKNGNDVIAAGEGDDILDGGLGNDTYIYNTGDDEDTIFDNHGTNKLVINGKEIQQLTQQAPGSTIYQLADSDGNPIDETTYTVTSNGLKINVGGIGTGDIINLVGWNKDANNIGIQLNETEIPQSPDGIQVFDFRNWPSNGKPRYPQATATARDQGGGRYYPDNTDPEVVYAYWNTSDTRNYERMVSASTGGGIGDSFIFGDEQTNWLVDDVFDLSMTLLDKDTPLSWVYNDPHLDPAIRQMADASDISTEVGHLASGNGPLMNLTNTAGNDMLYGGGGDDWLSSHGGDDWLFGQDGNDVLIDQPYLVPGCNHWMEIEGHHSDDYLYGGQGEDWMLSAQGDDHHDGGTGNDVLFSGADNDTLLGGAGDDVLFGDATIIDNSYVKFAITVNQVEGYDFDWVLEIADEEVDYGTDTLFGGDGDDVIAGGGGEDWLYGGGNNDELCGDGTASATLHPIGLVLPSVPYTSYVSSANEWRITAGNGEIAGNDHLYGESGEDTLIGGGGDDYLHGGDDNDRLEGDQVDLNPAYHGEDRLYGGSGDDYLFGFGGDDMLRGGDGHDYLDGDHDSLNEYNHGSDDLYGGAGEDYLLGRGGEDQLFGNAGNDELVGGMGDDLLNGGLGNDQLYGEEGVDTFTFWSGDGNDVIHDGDGKDKIRFYGVGLGAVSTSLVNGADGNTYLALQYSPTDTVYIKDGLNGAIQSYEFSDRTVTSDELILNTFTDSIDYQLKSPGAAYGGGQNDVLVGSIGNDELYGQDGDDILAGDSGDDRLAGGLGQDNYRIGRGTGKDQITEPEDESGTIQLQAGSTIDELVYERQGDDLYIRFEDSRDGAVITGFYLGDHSWQVQDDSGDVQLVRKDSVPGGGAAYQPINVEEAWDSFEKKVISYYEGLLRVDGYNRQTDGAFTRSITHRYTPSDHSSYSVTVAGTAINTDAALHARISQDYENILVDQQQVVESRTEESRNTSGGSYFGLGSSGANGISEAQFFELSGLFGQGASGVKIEGDMVPVYGQNDQVDPLTGNKTPDLVGYWIYPDGAPSPSYNQVTGTHTYYSYETKINTPVIVGGASDNEMRVGTGSFNLVDGGAGNDILDARSRDNSFASIISEQATYANGRKIQIPTNQVITNQAPGSLLYGNQGDDILVGGSLEDMLIGGPGSDYMAGGMGNDTYLLLDEGGGDTIFDDGWSVNGAAQEDTIVLPVGITLSDLTLTWGDTLANSLYMGADWWGRMQSVHTTLAISWAGSSGVTVILPHSDQNAGTGIDLVQFSNGDRIAFSSLMQHAGNVPGLDPHQDDNVIIGEGVLFGGAGNDYLKANEISMQRSIEDADDPFGHSLFRSNLVVGGAGSDRLEGSQGDDMLFGGSIIDATWYYDTRYPIGGLWDAGNIYRGGAGHDQIWATSGADIFEFDVGDGYDTVTDMMHFSNHSAYLDEYMQVSDALQQQLKTSHDTLKFGPGISPADILVTRSEEGGNDLLFSHINGYDAVTFANWFMAEINQLNRVEFTDGTVWDASDISNLALGLALNHTPVVNMPLQDQTASGDASFTYQVPEATFVDPDAGDILSMTATLSDGTPLPGWLSFDAATNSFSGIPDNLNTGLLEIQVTATDAGGKSAHDIFELIVEEKTGETIVGGPDRDTITGTAGADTIIGGAGKDRLRGGAGDDTINGGAGKDRLWGGAGHDTINGGAGKDRVWGGAGDDTINGGAGKDRVWGGAGDDTINGGAGKDRLWGGAGHDTINGGAGKDRLWGGAGDDIIIGGSGNDTINGGIGSDTYQFSRLDGQDRIRNFDDKPDDLDKLSFVDVASNELWFSMNGDDLVINVVGTNDRVTVMDWYLDDDCQLDTFEAADYSLQNNQVAQLVNAMAVFDVPKGAGGVMPQEVQDQLAPVLASSWQ
jgi:Ca2+-binding RTX toxin-like protein